MGIFVLEEVLNGPGAFKMPPQPNRRDSPPTIVCGCGIGRVSAAKEFNEANSQIGASANAQLVMHTLPQPVQVLGGGSHISMARYLWCLGQQP